MFLPYLISIQNIVRTPIVYLLLFINIYGAFALMDEESDRQSHMFLFKEKNLSQLGEYYFNSPYFPDKHDPADVTQLTLNQKVNLGIQTLRDRNVVEHLDEIDFTSDIVLNKNLKRHMSSFFNEQISRPSFSMGLNHMTKWTSYITYQLTHGGFLHLISNMVFLLTLGFYLEVLMGSLGFLFLFIMGGIAGGFFFNWFNEASFIPMIGASGSISAMLAFLAIHEPKRSVRFIFFLSPLKHHHGSIYLPIWWIIPLFLLSDFAYLISTPAGVTSGVAYAAHVGGAIFGALIAIMWRMYPTHSRWVQIHVEEYFQSESPAP